MSRRTLTLVAGFSLLHAVLAVCLHAGWIKLQQSGLPGTSRLSPPIIFSDLPIYHGWANRMAAGEVPYRDFRIEYPPLAAPFFLLPRLIATSRSGYIMAFAAEMLVFNALLVALVAGFTARREGEQRVAGRLGWMTLCWLALGPFVVGRFDVVPTVLAFASAVAWHEGRRARGGVLAGLGILAKLSPGVIGVLGFAAEATGRFRPRWRGTIACAVVVAAGFAIWFGLAGRGVIETFRYHTERGVEVGSTASGLLWAAATVTGRGFSILHDHESANMVTPWSAGVGGLGVPIQVALLGLVAWRFVKGGRRDFTRFSGAALLAFIVGGKVLSPQYLIWVMPFVVVLDRQTSRLARPLFLAACFATMLIYPVLTDSITQGEPLVFVLINIRNLALLGLWAVLTFAPVASSDGDPRPIGGPMEEWDGRGSSHP